MERDITYTALTFALLAGLWMLNRPWQPGQALFSRSLRLTLNLLGAGLFLLLTQRWLLNIHTAPYQPAIQPGTTRLPIAEQSFGKSWPLRAPSGTLECLPGQVVVFHTQGTTYGVNGLAKRKNYPPLEKLARRDRYLPSARQDLSQIQALGLRLCQ